MMAEKKHGEQHRPRLLWIGPLRTDGGITTITKRFIGDPEVHRRYQIKIQDQGYLGAWNEVGILRPLKVPIAVGLLFWSLLAFRPQIVHIHTSYLGGFLRDGILALVSKWFGKKVVMSFHSGQKTLPDLYYEGAGWLKWLSRQVVPRLDAIEASGPSYADFFSAEFGHENVHVVPNPVSDEDLPQTLSEYDTREQTVLFVGFMVQRKGVFELLKAAEEVPGARFVMVGRAPTPGDMKALQSAYDACAARDRIDLDIGWKELNRVYECMDRARLLALPSWGETLPLVLGEALLCGLPVVTTPVGVIGDYVQDGVHGCLIEPGDAEALAAAINRILDNPAWASEVSARNRVFGRQFLASEVHARRFEIYEQLLD